MTLWFDIEDLFDYVTSGLTRPSGIQRVSLEIQRAVVALGGPIRFIRHAAPPDLYQIVDWAEIEAHFAADQTAGPVVATPRRARSLPQGRVVQRIPEDIRTPLIAGADNQWQALRALGQFATAAVRQPMRVAKASRRGVGHSNPASGRFAELAAPGDTLLVLGSPWLRLYSPIASVLRGERRMRFGVLVHDLIPVRHPEWVDQGIRRVFEPWYADVLPHCDLILANSRHTAADVEAFMRERSLPRTRPVHTLPIGNGFTAGPAKPVAGLPAPGSPAPANPAPASPTLVNPTPANPTPANPTPANPTPANPTPANPTPANPTPANPTPANPAPANPTPANYVLVVATMEARKNHALAVAIWSRLLADVRAGRRAAQTLPDLVFAGRIGWLVADLVQQLDRTDWLGGRVRLVEAPTDAGLHALYAGCRFTLFPSFYEGWGLPVSESLGFGKACLSADTAALPEAGGRFCRYFDPDDLEAAYRAVAAILDDPAGLAAWEAEIKRDYQRTTWTDTAHALLAAVAAR